MTGCFTNAAKPLILALTLLAIPAQAWAYGEVQATFPTWYERIILVLTNEARADPVAALADCDVTRCGEKACHSAPLEPLQWDYDLARLARFHAANLTLTGCSMRHDSPCQLVANIAALYPDECNGSADCACQGGNASCSDGSTTWERFALFGISGGYRAENIAWLGDPKTVFQAWLWENSPSTECAWSTQNGHRWSILSPNYKRLGVGGYGGFTVQDFGSQNRDQKILGGAHYPEHGPDVEFLVNWMDSAGPSAAMVNLDGTCQPLALHRGSLTNGTFRRENTVSTQCVRYYFIFADANGLPVHHPTTGSFGINCPEDWSLQRPPAGDNCNCTPTCHDLECGDDGCGGSCGTCPDEKVCRQGQCGCPFATCGEACCAEAQVCTNDACCTPSCPDGACGDDGCGGECGHCQPPQLCVEGTCQCPNHLTQCEEHTCVDTLSDPSHCGACNQACADAEVCQNGLCDETCTEELTACDGACVDLEQHPLHCGQCFRPCPAHAPCAEGRCQDSTTEEDAEDLEPSEGDTSQPAEEIEASDLEHPVEPHAPLAQPCGCRLQRQAPLPVQTLPWLLLLGALFALWRQRTDHGRSS